MNVQIHPRFMLLLILTSFFRGEFGPSGGGGARWWSDDGGDSQASLQPGFDLLRRVTVAVQLFASSSGAEAGGGDPQALFSSVSTCSGGYSGTPAVLPPRRGLKQGGTLDGIHLVVVHSVESM